MEESNDDGAAVFRALGSDTRLAVLEWLAEPHAHFVSHREGDLADDGGVCVSLIAERARIAQPTMSRHLEVLRRAGLLRTRRVANRNFHYRDEDGILRARDLLARL